ncbi:MAG: hypothetical protein H0X07_04645 [Gemmatimonadales bacterium]|nr:hypothetical protein [Gemmatimonadales bacterium]
MNDWAATQRVSAEIVLADGVVLEGDLHLATRTAYHPDTESPLEMLNRPEPFFALTLQEGEVAFVSKAQVAVVSCRDQLPLVDPARASAARLVALEVALATGAEYRGRSTFELPPSRSRALDYINTPGSFFTVWSNDLTRYFNKALVRLIRPLD